MKIRKVFFAIFFNILIELILNFIIQFTTTSNDQKLEYLKSKRK